MGDKEETGIPSGSRPIEGVGTDDAATWPFVEPPTKPVVEPPSAGVGGESSARDTDTEAHISSGARPIEGVGTQSAALGGESFVHLFGTDEDAIHDALAGSDQAGVEGMVSRMDEEALADIGAEYTGIEDELSGGDLSEALDAMEEPPVEDMLAPEPELEMEPEPADDVSIGLEE
jgi:hypothetical protein